jgi:threonyl-tRNA synthetase
MRILQLHSNFIEYKPIKKEIAIAEKAEEKAQKFEDIVVLFVAVEKGDDEKVAKKAIEEVKLGLEKLKAKRVLIYPYAHLSSNLAKPAEALNVIKAMEKHAKNSGLETYRTPFGWNKQFTISIKGHPLAEQSRTFVSTEIEEEKKAPEEKISEAIKAEEKLKSTWFILQPNGKMIPVDEFDFSKHENLGKFARYEISKVRAAQQMPPHVILMKRLEIADYEPASDPGNFRWYPKGRLLKSLLEQYVTEETVRYGAMEVETPIMYDYNHPSLADYLNRFPARQYVLKSEEKELFLRFAACFGQFLIMHDTQFSYRQLPLRIYELTRYSFRREKSGELAGFRRLRAFTMPDCHAFCADLQQAKKEFVTRFKLCMRVLEGIGFSKDDYELGVRFTKDFYAKNKRFIVSLVKLHKRPVLVELWERQFFYYVMKWEPNFIDNQDKASALSTDQIDVENAKRYDITFTDPEGKKRYPLILHCSPSGAIERVVYALLEKAYREQQKGKAPMLPLWLAPTQVRIIPLSDKFEKDAEKIAQEIENNCIRVDVDNRPQTMQKKVREAETEWVNYVIVVGQKEIDSGLLPVRTRELGKIKPMKLDDLVAEIRRETEGKPFKPLSLPKLLSDRPQFYG